MLGNKHNRWTGDSIGYGGLHQWIRKTLGVANKCENREEQVLKFKCRNKTNFFEWANKSKKYSNRNREDWLQLCRSCHRLYDANKKSLARLKKQGFQKGLIPHNKLIKWLSK